MKKFSVVSLLVVLSLILAACAPAASTPAPTQNIPVTGATATPMPPTAEPTQAPQTIVDIAVADGRFTTLVAAVQAAGLAETLSGEGPFTVFAPTDEAFAALPAGTLDTLLEDPAADLKDILLYHVIPGKVMAADVAGLETAETALGKEVTFRIDGDKVFINDAQVILTDIEASNGVIHVIDSVILPPADDAMATEEEDAMAAEADIVDTAVADGRFTTLVAAVQAAGLVETLKGEGPFTVFAPTDEAFAKLPAGTIDALLEQPEGDLKDILLYHVVSGKVMAADVVKLTSAETVLGPEVQVRVEGDQVFINDAQVLITDIQTSNGVIHVIDSVLLPPQ